MAVRAPGRPTHLSSKEEQIVLNAVKFLRLKACPVDREVVQELARKAMSSVQNIALDKVMPLSQHWVKSFRKRHKLSRLRRATTDRGISTPVQIDDDNAWRQAYKAVCKDPVLYGIPLPAGGPTCLPLGMQCAVDETPLMYAPQVRGTYEECGRSKQITLVAAREKRMVTGSPLVTRAGEMLLFQIIFKGLTRQCEPPRQPEWHPKVFLDHAKKSSNWRNLAQVFGGLGKGTGCPQSPPWTSCRFSKHTCL